MQKTKKLTIEGLGEIEVKELTVAQVRQTRERMLDKDRPFYMVEALMADKGIPIEAVCLSAGLEPEVLEGDVPPSAAGRLWDAVGEVNDFLRDMIRRALKEGAATA